MNGAAALTVGGEFDGIGMLALGLHLAGLRHAWLCEVDPWRRSILELRFPGVPVFDDVRAVGAASAGPVDVIAGGFPCKGAADDGLAQDWSGERVWCNPPYSSIEPWVEKANTGGG